MTTVFTPTYNRANLLPRLFSSLCAQDCNDFEWLVVNDGSTDTTEDLFDEWMRNSHPFAIRYFKVSNGGKMCAINEALELANGDFFSLLTLMMLWPLMQYLLLRMLFVRFQKMMILLLAFPG